MADNVEVTAGSGTTVAADEVSDGTLGTVKAQYVKLMDGTIAGTSKALVDSSGLKVNLGADNDVTLVSTTITGTVAVTQSGTWDEVGINDSGNSITVDGTFWQATQPVSLATNTPTLQSGSTTTVTQATGTNLHTVIDSGTITTVSSVTAIANALPAGTNAIGKLAANSGVDIGDVDVTTVGTITPGSAASSLGKVEDAVHGSGDVGVAVWGVANAAQTTLAADGDYIGLATDVKGNLMVTGNIAHDSADAGNPVKIGGKASTTAPTAVTANDRVNAWMDLNGRTAIFGAYDGAFISTATTTTVKSGAGVIHSISVGAPGTVTTSNLIITIYDNTTASGTIIDIINVDDGFSTLMPFGIVYDRAFGTGLTIVTSGTNCQVQVSYL